MARCCPCAQPHHLYRTVLREFGPRLVVTCLAWMAANFAFYGAMLFQAEFFTALYPTVSLDPHPPCVLQHLDA